jgi:hypothetical protein
MELPITQKAFITKQNLFGTAEFYLTDEQSKKYDQGVKLLIDELKLKGIFNLYRE